MRFRIGRPIAFVLLTAALAPHGEGAAQPSAPAAPPASTVAATAETMSLAHVLENAVRHNPNLASATIDIEVAEARVLEASGIEDWLFAATGSFYSRRSDPSNSLVSTSENDRFSGTASIGKLLPTGGTISLQGDAEHNETVFAFGGGMKSEENSASLTATLDQPLLRGRGSLVTRANRTRAQIAADAARLQRDVVARTIVRDIIAAYWEVAYAAADLEIRRSSVVLAVERRRLTEASVQGGATAPTEVLATDQVIAAREEEVVGAELQVTERSLELRRLAGLEISPTGIEVTADAPLEVTPAPIDLAQTVDATFRSSPELAVLATRERGAKLEIEVSENGLLPRLDLRLYGGPLGVANKMVDAVEQTAKFEGYQVGADLTFEHPFGRRTARGVEKRARAERQRVMVDTADVRAQLTQATAQAVALARSAEKRMTLSRTGIELSEKNIKAEIGRFELGKSTNFDVLARQEELKQARLRYARAVTDYLRAMTFLGALTGEILGQYGIKVE